MSSRNEKLAQRTRRNLQEFRTAFTDIRFDTALHALPKKDQERAALARFGAALAVQRIDNDGFASIAGQLAAQAPDIRAGIAELDDALDDLTQARAIVDAAGAAVSLVGQVLKLVGVKLPV
ncbi:MAG: hypothetical protein V2A74_04330 [bacterium]